VWRDYFPTAHIIGCDIDGDILFKEERISTFQCDQTSDKSIQKFIRGARLSKESVDIIIDDGLHQFHAGKCFFENMISRLRADGIYIIEDVHYLDIVRYKEYFAGLEDLYEARFVFLKSPNKFSDDNNIVCITKKYK
jgi:hypothetical protein